MKIKKLAKVSVLVLVVSLVSTGLYMLYFYTIGIPKTQARTYYNLAISALKEGKKDEAKQDLEKALQNWKEPYIQEELDKLQ